ncbi:hypothetical protein RUND412_010527 [Rhizina undulata]
MSKGRPVSVLRDDFKRERSLKVVIRPDPLLEDEVRKFMSKYRIQNIRMFKWYSFVDLSSPSDAIEAIRTLDNTFSDGLKYCVQASKHAHRPDPTLVNTNRQNPPPPQTRDCDLASSHLVHFSLQLSDDSGDTIIILQAHSADSLRTADPEHLRMLWKGRKDKDSNAEIKRIEAGFFDDHPRSKFYVDIVTNYVPALNVVGDLYSNDRRWWAVCKNVRYNMQRAVESDKTLILRLTFDNFSDERPFRVRHLKASSDADDMSLRPDGLKRIGSPGKSVRRSESIFNTFQLGAGTSSTSQNSTRNLIPGRSTPTLAQDMLNNIPLRAHSRALVGFSNGNECESDINHNIPNLYSNVSRQNTFVNDMRPRSDRQLSTEHKAIKLPGAVPRGPFWNHSGNPPQGTQKPAIHTRFEATNPFLDPNIEDPFPGKPIEFGGIWNEPIRPGGSATETVPSAPPERVNLAIRSSPMTSNTAKELQSAVLTAIGSSPPPLMVNEDQEIVNQELLSEVAEQLDSDSNSDSSTWSFILEKSKEVKGTISAAATPRKRKMSISSSSASLSSSLAHSSAPRNSRTPSPAIGGSRKTGRDCGWKEIAHIKDEPSSDVEIIYVKAGNDRKEFPGSVPGLEEFTKKTKQKKKDKKQKNSVPSKEEDRVPQAEGERKRRKRKLKRYSTEIEYAPPLQGDDSITVIGSRRHSKKNKSTPATVAKDADQETPENDNGSDTADTSRQKKERRKSKQYEQPDDNASVTSYARSTGLRKRKKRKRARAASAEPSEDLSFRPSSRTATRSAGTPPALSRQLRSSKKKTAEKESRKRRRSEPIPAAPSEDEEDEEDKDDNEGNLEERKAIQERLKKIRLSAHELLVEERELKAKLEKINLKNHRDFERNGEDFANSICSACGEYGHRKNNRWKCRLHEKYRDWHPGR